MLAIIGGSGFDQWQHVEDIKAVSVKTPYGLPSDGLLTFRLQGQPAVFIPRHGSRHHYAPHQINYRANIWALKELGVTKIVAIAAVGGIDASVWQPCLIIPDQIIDYTCGREHTFWGEDHPMLHIDFTAPYCERLRRKLLEHCDRLALPHAKSGVYAVTQGPRLETAAEIRRLQQDGATIVGMTGMPEAALARELDINYACVAMSVNPAAGLTDAAITMEMIQDNLNVTRSYVESLLHAFIGDNDEAA